MWITPSFPTAAHFPRPLIPPAPLSQMESEEKATSPAPAPADANSQNDHDQQQHQSLAKRFAALCTEANATTTSPFPSSPALPSLTAKQSHYLARNPAGEVYLTPDAISAAEGPDRPSVLAAFRAALADAYGDDNVEGTLSSPAFQHLSEEEDLTANESFMSLAGLPERDLPQITGFTWEGSVSQQAVNEFVAGWHEEREEREREEAAEAAAAMARAAAAGAGRSRQPRAPRPVAKRRYSFNADPVVWAAQEDAAAAAVLRELRASLGKLRKGSSKAPHESSAVWALLKEGKGKLKPEAAAEMARAKVAAAAAAAAMREVEREARPEDSMQDLKGEDIGFGDKDHAEVMYEQLDPNRRAASGRFEGLPYEFLYSKSPGFPRALSLDSSTRLKNVGKKKRVEFAAGTVFVKK